MQEHGCIQYSDKDESTQSILCKISMSCTLWKMKSCPREGSAILPCINVRCSIQLYIVQEGTLNLDSILLYGFVRQKRGSRCQLLFNKRWHLLIPFLSHEPSTAPGLLDKKGEGRRHLLWNRKCHLLSPFYCLTNPRPWSHSVLNMRFRGVKPIEFALQYIKTFMSFSMSNGKCFMGSFSEFTTVWGCHTLSIDIIL
jgi:hypothetical protein